MVIKVVILKTFVLVDLAKIKTNLLTKMTTMEFLMNYKRL